MKGLKFDLKLRKVILKKMKLAGTFSMVKYKENWPKPKITFQNQVMMV